MTHYHGVAPAPRIPTTSTPSVGSLNALRVPTPDLLLSGAARTLHPVLLRKPSQPTLSSRLGYGVAELFELACKTVFPGC